MEIVVIYVFFCLLVGAWAGSWGRNGALWFFIAMLVSPLFSGIALLIAGKVSASQTASGSPGSISPSTHVTCPECAEYVRKEARSCKHCGTKLIPVDDGPAPERPPGAMSFFANLTVRQAVLLVVAVAIVVAMLNSGA